MAGIEDEQRKGKGRREVKRWRDGEGGKIGRGKTRGNEEDKGRKVDGVKTTAKGGMVM